jgi:SAM-dependent methyltransferase
MESLFGSSIIEPIRDDPRTDWSENLSLGYPFEIIREEVLAKGLADFAHGHDHPTYGRLSAEEKVLLYCFLNMRKHFFAALATFEAHRPTIEGLFVPDARLLVIDIGCGPGTACLALADLLPGRDFDFLGIDSAEPMRFRAQAFWNAARARGLIGKGATASFKGSWTEIKADQLAPATSVFVVLSYCCASHTLTLHSLQSMAHTVQAVASTRAGRPLVLAYMNSTNQFANIGYEAFKQALGLDPEKCPLTRLTIEYRNKRGGTVPGKEEFVNEVLCLKRS